RAPGARAPPPQHRRAARGVRQARPPPRDRGPPARPSFAEPYKSAAFRPPRQFAGTAARNRAGRGAGSDRHRDRQSAAARSPSDRQRAAGQEVNNVVNAPESEPACEPPREAPCEPLREPWRRRLLRTLLYGSNVDRAAKARARIGLAILVFAIGYAVIAARLVMFA